MITVGIIRNGATYLSHHLRKNDYWAEGEKAVPGEWIGEGAKALGLSGEVTDAPFEALRCNRHPRSGEFLTSLDAERKVAFVDVQLSAPKDVSVLAMVGGDERVRVAFVESVKVALSEVLRQRNEADRRFSRLLASGEIAEAFAFADRRGLIREAEDDDTLFARAAEHYVGNREKGGEALVVIPFWDEIERFNTHVRPALRKAGLLGSIEVTREAVKPLTWTAEQKVHWDQYKVGDRLLFARDTRFFKRGVAAEVIAIMPNGVRVRGPKGREAKITRKQSGAFDVGRVQALAVAVGDRLLIRGRDDDAGFSNGDFTEVAHVDPTENKIVLTDGRELPPDFAAWTYGHALTSYRSQGSTS